MLLAFSIFMLLCFISALFLNNDVMNYIFVISILISGILILTSIILLIFGQIYKKEIEISEAEIEELNINSAINVDQIKKKTEIKYFGNILRITNDRESYELDNSTAFELLKKRNKISVKNHFIKINELDMSPKSLLHDIFTSFWGWS